jgi:3-hydroxyisobutyrate dehydrogenase-like beta-hydroxyacid dehydrogenase
MNEPQVQNATRRTTVIGTGTMGSALARALLAAGHEVTVWNRTRSRAEQLQAAGASVADTTVGAAERSDVVLMCVSDQAAAAAMLSDQALTDCLRGKTLVQLTTGTAADGRRNAAWAADLGIRYADGAMLAYPREIGTPDAVILYCGAVGADSELQLVLQALGSARFVGDDAGRAAAVDAALIAFFYGTMAGFIQAAVLAQAEGLTIDELTALSGPFFSRFIANAVTETGERVRARDYSDPQSSMDAHFGGIDLLVVGASRDAGVDTAVVTAIRNSFARAIAAGRGGDDIACLVEVLNEPGVADEE